MPSAHFDIVQAIEKVEDGKFDVALGRLEKDPLGIIVSALVVDGVVSPMPKGMHQVETNMQVTASTERVTKAFRVSWALKRAPNALAAGHSGMKNVECKEGHDDYEGHCYGHCRDHQSTKAFSDSTDPDLSAAAELHPEEVYPRIEEYKDLLLELSQDNLGLFLVHGHSWEKPFTELPMGCMSVIEDGRTRFRRREDVLSSSGFVPNVWRLEYGVRQPVGGFIAY